MGIQDNGLGFSAPIRFRKESESMLDLQVANDIIANAYVLKKGRHSKKAVPTRALKISRPTQRKQTTARKVRFSE